MEVSSKDLDLIELLKRDARMSMTDIAARLGVSRATAQKRLDRLEEKGVIASYTVVLSDEFLKHQVRAHMLLEIRPNSTSSVIAKMKSLREVERIHSVSGSSDLIAVLSAQSVVALDQATDFVIAIDGVERTITSVILSTKYKK